MQTWKILFFCSISLSSCGKEKTLVEQYPGPWLEPSPEVMITLAKNHVRGCGEFYQKPAADAPYEYVVACTRDGETWTAWLVWPASEKVLGPDDMAIWKLGGPPKRK